VAGTYLHGVFHDDGFRHIFLRSARKASGLAPAEMIEWKRLRDQEFDRLAQAVASSVDMNRLLRMVGLNWPSDSPKEKACAPAR